MSNPNGLEKSLALALDAKNAEDAANNAWIRVLVARELVEAELDRIAHAAGMSVGRGCCGGLQYTWPE